MAQGCARLIQARLLAIDHEPHACACARHGYLAPFSAPASRSRPDRPAFSCAWRRCKRGLFPTRTSCPKARLGRACIWRVAAGGWIGKGTTLTSSWRCMACGILPRPAGQAELLPQLMLTSNSKLRVLTGGKRHPGWFQQDTASTATDSNATGPQNTPRTAHRRPVGGRMSLA